MARIPKLSILIRTIPQRKHLLDELLAVLNQQKTENVEIIIDDEYPKFTGKKNNDLILASYGNYVCFVDDDDLVPEYYVEKLLEAIKENPDVITLEGWCEQTHAPEYRYIQTLHNKGWTYDDNGTLLCDATNISAVKREIALQCKVPDDMMYFEDRNYADILKTIAKTEIHISDIMYIHRYKTEKEYKI